MPTKKKMTIEDLAGMVKRGFDETATKEDLKRMATKEDFRQIREEVATKEDLDTFAGMVKRGFDETATKAETATKRDLNELRHELATFEQKTEDNFRGVNARLDLLREDISDLPSMREALLDLETRVEQLEHRAKMIK